ncbi:MAG: helix-turn-helix transcriptional regulator [Pseudomonadota bacterium]|nr:helix-turn-helix transcriptional regulator [Pseudomonadota bacterium]MDP1906001.1 helix-turn-helix transcriptional regulator [Pseudomonadota bacterium]MDP2352472.1 helix-turn-helix transcriptional regulator [Pseudomonadota bacterium]
MHLMFSDNVHTQLTRMGVRLRAERLARNEPQARFAARLGISIPTLRRLEQGDASAQIGHWLAALEVLGRLPEAEALLAPRYSLFDAAAETPKTRQRARRLK